MQTIREIYRIGHGPSSSHTMGPRRAAELFLERHPNAAKYQAHLYGSLSATGKGHLTDAAIIDVIPSIEVVWHDEFLSFHPNGLRFMAWDENEQLLEEWTVYSVGGGALSEGQDDKPQESPNIYPLTTLTQIAEYCEQMG
ncbi:MAG: serine dehydratase beta chain, partial [Paludibacteraceae bacterium]|nr:serine dehydratase beta chain [Paludibacteraceae bacterium]